MGVSPNLRFSSSRSFRLFTEGVQALQSYEQAAQKTFLDRAASKLAECVSNFQDVLPRLYLGIVRFYQGEAAGEAIALLREVLDRDLPELNSTAKYYLAETYVSKYTTDDISRADVLLTELLSEPNVSVTDRLSAESLRAFIYVRQILWKNRSKPISLVQEEQEAAERLDKFKTNIEKAQIPDTVKTALWADYWNIVGLFEEYRANRTTDEAHKRNFAEKSLASYEKARYGVDKADAESNQARVYYELLKDANKAVRLAKDVLEIRENDSFANLLLGRIYESDQPESAIHHYLKAQAKFFEEGAVGAGRCYERLEEFDNALDEFGKITTSKPLFAEATYQSGLIQERLGRIEDARASFERVPAEDKEYFKKAQAKLASLKKN